MAERQITVASVTYPLPKLFLVMATQNPIEQEGTYPLPEAQLDRFLLHVRIQYPDATAEKNILRLARAEARAADTPSDLQSPIPQDSLFLAREQILDLHMAPALEDYIVSLVLATRQPGRYGQELAHWVEYGGSPRATIALDRCARAQAWLAGKDFVAPGDIQAVAPDVLRHRLILSYEAEAEGVTPDRVVGELLQRVAVP